MRAQTSAEQKGPTQSFLTEAQRSALDAALAAKAAENKALKLSQKSQAGDKKPRSLKGQGAVKKAGGGGKFTWGSVLTNGADALSLDHNDPNYDSEEEKNVVLKTQHYQLKAEVTAYKAQIQSIAGEYFDSADISNVATSLDELGSLDMSYYFVKRLVMLALDRKDREREMTSTLLSSLYAEVIPPAQMLKGFEVLVESIDDLALDVPDAPDLLATFIARGVVDDILPPAFLQKVPLVEGSLAKQVAHKAELLLSGRHSAEKILRCWGNGPGRSYADTKASITVLLNEFLGSGDSAEAARCLRALGVPFFHHELVKQAVGRAMEEGAVATKAVTLLKYLSTTGEISEQQLAKGVGRVSDNLDDSELDNPGARDKFVAVVAALKEAELLSGDDATRASRGGAAAPAVAGGANGATPHSVQEFKLVAAAAIREYFGSGDGAEVASRLSELNDPGLHPLFVKAAIALAMDRKDRERELVSTLLVQLYPATLDGEQLASGFTRLLAAVDDLVLDIPDAVHLLSLFLGRAIVDELLPPSFLASALPALSPDGLGVAVVKATAAQLSSRHSAERLLSAWHGGCLDLHAVKSRIRGSLEEYVVGGDAREAADCIKALGLPYFNHEVVVEAIELAFEHEAHTPALIALLAMMAESGEISQTQMAKGFRRIQENLEDETLDNPHACDVLAKFVEAGLAGGWLVLDEPPAPAVTESA